MPLSEEGRDTQGPDAAPASGADVHELSRCTNCSGGVLARQDVNTAFWQGTSLVVVEGIPALVCQTCGEQFYEDETAMKLDLMRGAGFPADKAVRSMTVPVFDFEASNAGGLKDKSDA